MFFRTLIFAIFTLSLSGCITPYVLPPDIPKATLSLSTNMNGVMVRVYSNEQCGKSQYGNRLAYFFAGMFDDASGVDKKIPANKEFIYTFVYSSGVAPYTSMAYCDVTIRFIPRPNDHYVSVFTNRNGKCVANILHVIKTDTGEHLAVEKTAHQIKPTCKKTYTNLDGT